MNEAVTLDGNPFQEEDRPDNRFNDYQHAKVLIQVYQRDIADYRRMKEEEKKDGLSNGRRKLFNQQISDLREKIQGLEEKL
jgi:hypothetical protein